MNSNWYLITVAHGAVGWIKHSGASPYGKIMYIYLDIILQYWTSLDWTLGQFSMCIMSWSIENKYLNVKAFIVHYYSSLIWSCQMLLTQPSLYLGAAASRTMVMAVTFLFIQMLWRPWLTFPCPRLAPERTPGVPSTCSPHTPKERQCVFLLTLFVHYF